MHGLSCSAVRGIFPDQGSNLCLLHWQVDSLPRLTPGKPLCDNGTYHGISRLTLILDEDITPILKKRTRRLGTLGTWPQLHGLKDDAVKVLRSIRQQIWKTQQWPQDWKRSVFIPIPKKSNAKECSNYCTIALISHASKVMLKILKARFQQYVSHKLPDVQAGFRKGRGIRNQIAICWIIEKAREFHKNI